MKESALVQKIIKAVKAEYPRAYVRKLADRFTRGVPDLLIVVQCSEEDLHQKLKHDGTRWWYEWGGILFVETKTKKGRLSKLQERELDSIRENGGEAIMAQCVATVMAKLKEMGAVK